MKTVSVHLQACCDSALLVQILVNHARHNLETLGIYHQLLVVPKTTRIGSRLETMHRKVQACKAESDWYQS